MSEGLSVVEFATRLRVTKQTVYSYVRLGLVESHKEESKLVITTDPSEFKRPSRHKNLNEDRVIATRAVVKQKNGKTKTVRSSSVIGLIKKLKELL